VSEGNGIFTFDPGTDFQDLAAGQTRQVQFTYSVTDSHNAVSTETVTVTVTGIDVYLSIDDITVNEAAGVAVFTVTLSNSVNGGVSVNWSTSDDTAFDVSDYSADADVLSFVGNAGETQTITITLTEDLTVEAVEQFLVNLSNAQATGQNVLIADGQGVATIVDNLPPEIDELSLALDTGTPGDLITAYPVLTGSLSDADQTESSYQIQIDYNNDGISDLSLTTDELFTIDLGDYLPDGEVTVQVRAGEWEPLLNADIYGDWTALTFTYDSVLNEATPFISGLTLANDTDTPGDLISSDATVTGQIIDDGTNSEYLLQIDLDNDGSVDVNVPQVVGQQFTYDLGTKIGAGVHTIGVRALGLPAEDSGYIYGVWSTLTFTYDVPLEVNASIDGLELVDDTGIDDDQITIDPELTGTVTTTEDYADFTVEIDFQNDGSVETTTSLDQNGIFSFDPTASISAGQNIIAVRLVDNTTGAVGDWTTISFELFDLPVYTLSNESVQISQDTLAEIPIVAMAEYRDHISVEIITQPLHGSVTNTTNEDLTRTFTYTPDENYTGTDTLTYSVTDVLGNTTTATITFTMFANEAPTTVADEVEAYGDEPLTINVLENDSDADTDSFSLISVSDPLFGTLEIEPAGSDPGTIIYTANEYFVGQETLTYTIEDEHGRTTTGTLIIHITQRPDPEITDFGLLNDTEYSGDMITEDASVRGRVTSTRDLAYVRIEIDYDGDEIADVTTVINVTEIDSFRYDTGQ
ncbi:MAG: Ig-like domain-containing protein, partial [Gimesia chilikensis]